MAAGARRGRVYGRCCCSHTVVARPALLLAQCHACVWLKKCIPPFPLSLLNIQALPPQMALHHYVIKSRREYGDKMARGSGAGNQKSWGYWDYIEAAATQVCGFTEAVVLGVVVAAVTINAERQLPCRQANLMGIGNTCIATHFDVPRLLYGMIPLSPRSTPAAAPLITPLTCAPRRCARRAWTWGSTSWPATRASNGRCRSDGAPRALA